MPLWTSTPLAGTTIVPVRARVVVSDSLRQSRDSMPASRRIDELGMVAQALLEQSFPPIRVRLIPCCEVINERAIHNASMTTAPVVRNGALTIARASVGRAVGVSRQLPGCGARRPIQGKATLAVGVWSNHRLGAMMVPCALG